MQKIKSFLFFFSCSIEDIDRLTKHLKQMIFYTQPDVRSIICSIERRHLTGDEEVILAGSNCDFSKIKNKKLAKAHTVGIGKKTRE